MINLTQDAKSVIFKDNAGVVLKSIEKGLFMGIHDVIFNTTTTWT